MQLDAARLAQIAALSAAVCVAAMALLARRARFLRLIDEPGGRKAHAQGVPLVGGLAMFVALAGASLAAGTAAQAAPFLAAMAMVAAVGCWDDVADISPRTKFLAQIAACAVMIWGAGVELRTVGDLLGWRPIGLSILAIPMTAFAVIGVVNAINMVDGLDGLGGSIALVAFAWYALVSAQSGLGLQAETAVALCGALGAFLLFNLRFPWQPRARLFMGDAGSLALGFALGWFAVDLTQGPGRTFPPIAALWVVLLPLADCVSLMARRLRAGRSPFVGDAHHLHHYLQRRGWGHGQVLGFLVGLSALFGGIGYLGWRLQWPEAALFWPFFFGFFAYHFAMGRAWERLDRWRADPSRPGAAP